MKKLPLFIALFCPLIAFCQSITLHDLLYLRVQEFQEADEWLQPAGWFLDNTTNNAAGQYSEVVYGYGKPDTKPASWITYRYGEEHPVSVTFQTVLKPIHERLMQQVQNDGLKAIYTTRRGLTEMTDYEGTSYVVHTEVIGSDEPNRTEYIVCIMSKDEYNLVQLKRSIESN